MENRETEKNMETDYYDDKIYECLDQIIKLCGEDRVLDKAMELCEEDEEMFSEQVDKLIDTLCDLAKAKREKLEYKSYILKLSDVKFWKRVQQEVEGRTNEFLRAVSFNSLERAVRHELLQQGFNDIFCERESYDYVVNKVNNNDVAQTLYGVLMESEYAIVTAYVSKRRFMVGVADSYGLIKDDLEYIWTMFEHNREAVEKHEFHRRNIYMERMMERMNESVEELKERTESLEELILLKQEGFEKDIH